MELQLLRGRDDNRITMFATLLCLWTCRSQRSICSISYTGWNFVLAGLETSWSDGSYSCSCFGKKYVYMCLHVGVSVCVFNMLVLIERRWGMEEF